MAMTAEQYRDQLIALQPPGRALPTDPESIWAKLLHAIADGLARVDGDIENMINELDPRTTTLFIEDWERFLGLPELCLPAPGTTQERRNAIVAKLRARGGQTAQYLIGLAAALGYIISIVENGNGQVTVQTAETANIVESTCLSPCTDPLRTWGNTQLECLINHYKPAHITAGFQYGV